MTILPTLERDLVDAATRAGEAGEADRNHGAPATRAHNTRERRAGALAVALCSGVAIAVAAVLLLAGHAKRNSERLSPAVVRTPVSGRQQLIDIIGVLRRPQTRADLNPVILRQLERPIGGLGGSPDIPLMRYAATTPWGERLYFVPMKPPTSAQLARLRSTFPRLPPTALARLRARPEGLGVDSTSGGGGGVPASFIEAHGELSWEGAGRSFAGGSTETRLVEVVPDGVAMVELLFPRQPNPSGPPGTDPISRRALTARVPVHGNIAAVQIDRQFYGQMAQIWYAADGQVIKRIGNFARLYRVVPGIKPGPLTAQARAALKNPETPNKVTVTPQLGTPSTDFSVHFRVLVSDADYSFDVTGPCPRHTFSGGQGGGPTDTRGRIYSAPLNAIRDHKLCPGTYAVSVSIMDFGANGNLRHPAGPFGSATFTVRP